MVDFASSDKMFVEYLLSETNSLNGGLEFSPQYCQLSDGCQKAFTFYICRP